MSADPDYYDILEVPTNATPSEIHEAYRLLTMAWHPDRFPEGPMRDTATERMVAINSANEVLRDAVLREDYDRSRYVPEPTVTPEAAPATTQPETQATSLPVVDGQAIKASWGGTTTKRPQLSERLPRHLQASGNHTGRFSPWRWPIMIGLAMAVAACAYVLATYGYRVQLDF